MFGIGRPTLIKDSFFGAILHSGLSANLRTVIDPGDRLSFDGTSQTVVDATGQGNSFFRGATSSVETSDPTFAGTVDARDGDTYLSTDGNEFLRFATANPAWVNAIHGNNAIYSFAGWFYFNTLSNNQGIAATEGGSVTNIGFSLYANDNVLTFRVVSGSQDVGATHPNVIVADTWQFLGVSVNEGAGTGFLYLNGVESSFVSTYAGPSASAATFTLEIGAFGNAVAPFLSGDRIGPFAFWEGGANLSDTDFDTLWTRTRGRFGV